ncbi:MAG: hypothetical protein OXN23_00940 [Gammaproteobacteria bacterium]|nr:hypothetical protein [Gammaproteobacteria bacterium]MDE0302552.1 hypothetical protein [Gammaproteobacteria bacterium]
MLEAYGVLVLAGLCILLVIWIHGHQARRPSRPVSGGRESVAPVKSLYANRTGDEPDYVELEQMSRETGLQTYRIENMDLPCESLTFSQPQQMEILLRTPGESLLLVLHAAFSEPCSGEALHGLLSQAGLQIAEDGLYRKTQERQGHSVPIYFVASHSQTGSFTQQGRLIEALHRITFFTQLPLPVNGLHVFNGMLRVAREVCDKFGGILQDEEEVPLTSEAAEAMTRKVEAFVASHSDLNPVLAH